MSFEPYKPKNADILWRLLEANGFGKVRHHLRAGRFHHVSHRRSSGSSEDFRRLITSKHLRPLSITLKAIRGSPDGLTPPDNWNQRVGATRCRAPAPRQSQESRVACVHMSSLGGTGTQHPVVRTIVVGSPHHEYPAIRHFDLPSASTTGV